MKLSNLFTAAITFASLTTLALPQAKFSGAYFASGKVISITSGCPKGAMCLVASSKVNLIINLNGCTDQLLDFSSKVVRGEDGKTKLIVSAIGGANPTSLTARCIAAPTQSASVTILEKPDSVEFMESNRK